ncbi:hypothetical protein K040078D81_24690 [Blautia hominis]|uniref:Calcineurin-like phosphoesterase domain-containing protein n=1 Tax=Blautia hominis TaxID=2025493 RepID=A0ABQ0BA90_9FIRM
MRWMHISDIHMNKEFNNVMSNILREELPKFIVENKITVDYLFVTGDYRDSVYMKEDGLKEDVYLQALNVSEYILKIAQLLSVSSKHVYLVPGNHDLNRHCDDKKVIDQINKSYPLYRESLKDTELEYLLKRFDFFDIIDRQIHPNSKTYYRASHQLYNSEKADILCLNTAITCYGEEKEGDLILDTELIRKIADPIRHSVPLIVLAHHDFKFLTKKEEENLKYILKGRKVFYLCGHSHKLEYGYDDELEMWKIMVGTTKYANGATPIVSLVDTLNSGMISKLQFYKYDYIDKTGWTLYQEISQQIGTYKLGFTNKSISKDTIENFDVVQLPLLQTTSSTKIQRLETIKILAEVKFNLNNLGKVQHISVSSNGLPVNAGILIGYALHKRQNIQLSYLYRNMTFTHGVGKKIIQFKEIVNCDNISTDNSLSMYVYIQAKSRDDGSPAFYEYIKQKGLSNIYILSFFNTENYNENFDLELSAKYLIDRILEYYEDIRKKGYKKIKVHLFYNGFWGLALLLGNQMPTTFYIQLYDYDASVQQYNSSFLLKSNIFNL